MQTKWFHFRQKNSGGSFEFNADEGITVHVIVEAVDADHANARAKHIGLYFDGCSIGADCSCCGDRWHPVDESDGTPDPMVYEEPAETFKPDYSWRRVGENPEVFVHSIGGAFTAHGA